MKQALKVFKELLESNQVSNDVLVRKIMSFQKELNDLDEILQMSKSALKVSLGDYGKYQIGNYTVTFQPKTRTSIKGSEILKDNPGIDKSKYEIVTSYDDLRIK